MSDGLVEFKNRPILTDLISESIPSLNYQTEELIREDGAGLKLMDQV
jgi:hypothetical protein